MRAMVAASRVFESWLDYQNALKRAVAPLTAEQLVRPVLPGRRTTGAIAEHIVFGRALHLTRTPGADAAELEPYVQWGEVGAPSRSGAEIVEGLDATWRAIEGQLMRGTATGGLTDEEADVVKTTWGLMDHDLPHAGQLSLLLHAMGLSGVDI